SLRRPSPLRRRPPPATPFPYTTLFRSGRECLLIQFTETGQGVVAGRSDRATCQQRAQYRLDKAAVLIATGAVAVGPYIGQLAAGIPDGDRWASRPVSPAGRQSPVRQVAQHIAPPPGQTARPGEPHPLSTETRGHLAYIGFMAGIAGAAALPYVYHLNLPRRERPGHLVAGKIGRALENLPVPSIHPPPGPDQPRSPHQGQAPQQPATPVTHADSFSHCGPHLP